MPSGEELRRIARVNQARTDKDEAARHSDYVQKPIRDLKAAIAKFLPLEATAGYPHLVPLTIKETTYTKRQVGFIFRRTVREPRIKTTSLTGWQLFQRVDRTPETHGGGNERYVRGYYLLGDGQSIAHIEQFGNKIYSSTIDHSHPVSIAGTTALYSWPGGGYTLEMTIRLNAYIRELS